MTANGFILLLIGLITVAGGAITIALLWLMRERRRDKQLLRYAMERLEFCEKRVTDVENNA